VNEILNVWQISCFFAITVQISVSALKMDTSNNEFMFLI
jgi:hypothetical protein